MSWIEGKQTRCRARTRNNKELLDLEGFLEENDAKIALYEFLRGNITFASDLILGIKLFPFQHMAVKSMFETDYFLGVWCLNQDDYVLSEQGFKKIKNVKIGDRVRSRKKLNLVTNKKTNPLEEGLEITLNSGDSFKAKKGHKVLVYDRNNFVFKNIEDLNCGDDIPIKLETDIWGNLNITKGSNYKRSPYLFYTLGYILGDGWVNQDGLHYCSENAEVHKTIYTFINENGLKSYSRQRSENLFFYEYSVFDRKLISWLESLGWDKSLKSKDKVIPDELLKGSKNELCALIGGLFDADGYASFNQKSNKVGLKSTSLSMLRQVKMLLNNIGIISFLRRTGQHKKQPYYDLVISNDNQSLRLFEKHIDFIVEHKKEKLNKILQFSEKRNYQNNLVPNLGQVLKQQGSFKKITGRKGNWGKSFSQNSFNQLKNLPSETESIIENIKDEKVFFSKIKSINNCKVISVDIEVENEENYLGNGFVHHNSRGMSKSFTTGIYAALDALLNQGVEIGILSKSFRQAKMIFKKIEDIAAKPEAAFFKQCITKVSKSNDEWLMEIGRSRIRALPLGDGEKLRGFRFQRIIIDEFLLMPERIYNEVIVPFLSVVENPTQRQELYGLETMLIEQGKMKEEERYIWPNNKLIALSSASYKFEYLYKLYNQFDFLITQENEKDKATRCIMQFSYDCAPSQLYDQNLVNQAKATMSQSQFDREFGAVFTDDSSGYFKTSKMADCTIQDGDLPCVEVQGDPSADYILAFDPSWSQTESSDDFAIQILKLHSENEKCTLVHSYALSGTSLKHHINYFLYCLDNFNIVAIVGDYNGGVQFLQSCNESEAFQSRKLKLKTIDISFENPEEYKNDLRMFKIEYNKSDNKIVYLRKPTSKWIRQANELLQSNFDHRRLFFASRAIDESYSQQKKKSIPIEDLKFLRSTEETKQSPAAKMIDFIEHQSDMIDLTKNECALIQITTTSQGTQTFDLPPNLRRQSGPDKARKDSYSALVLGNWMAKIYFDSNSKDVEEVFETFTPMFIN